MPSWNFLLGILLYHTLQAALAQLPSQPESCSGQSQKISLSHSYKIDIPKSSQIKVEPEPLPLQDDSHTLVVGGETDEEQNIIFRHNIRLQTPKGDCEVLSQMKALLERMEKMEVEVIHLRQACSPQRCCGRSQGVSSCSGHGTFIQELCSCRCDKGWEGEDCSRATCPENCNGNGICINGVCQCYKEFIGDDCSEKRCPNDCSGNGYCDSGECYCEDGFIGLDCSKVIAPWNARLLKSSEDSLTIGWDRITEVDYYLVSYFPVGHEASVKQVRVPEDQLSYEILNLHSGTKYVITIHHVKKGVSSDPGLLQASTAVATIGAIWVTETTENSLEVEWENPATEVDYYKLRVSSLLGLGEEKEVLVPKSSDPKSRYIITGLIPGTQYKITVVSVKNEIEGEPSSVNGWTAKEIDIPKNLMTERVTKDTATISWEKVQALVDRYSARCTSVDGDTKEVSVGTDKSSTTLTGLHPGKEYVIYVWAEKGNQQSQKAKTKAVTEIDGPTNLVTHHVTEDTATISWHGSQAPIERYIVTYTSADGDTKEVSVGKDKRTTTLTGLKPGMEYTIYIWAVKGAQQSRKASAKALTEIDGPTNLVTHHVTEDTATISWHGSQAPIERYIVTYTSADGDTKEVSVGKDKRTTTLTGLKPGMEYTIYIWAVKGAQQSRKASAKALTEIDSPTSLRTDQATENSATISWKKPLAVIDRYILSYTSADGETRELAIGKDKTSTTLTGLKPGMEYVIYIWAVKGTKSSKRTSTKAVTEIDPPRNVRVSDVMQSSAVVTWMPPDAQINGYLLTYQEPDGTIREVRLGPNEQKFVLEGLSRGTKYTIYITAFKGDRWSRKAAITFSTANLLYPYPADCSQTQQNGHSTSGIYTIYLNGDLNRPFQVYCDMTTDGGGWIVFQRRNTGQLDFFKRWRNYAEGFGDPRAEFWLGLEKLHEITSSAPFELRVDLQTHNDSAYATYDLFRVGSSRERYRLSVGKYRGTAGDAMTYHNERRFTTWDRDNDIAISNCAITHHGGWWYKNCHLANLNGKYGEDKHSEGVNWEPWTGHLYSIPRTEMKIRPRSHSFDPVLGRRRRSLAETRKALSI
uniref:tenascin-N n=1 Tax=Euleptes europaea TaxID=460621 RepID=UPI0025419443|nr:tenascin-N [Euleptes europaea]